MSGAASRRLGKELAELNSDSPEYVTAQPDESNILHWTGTITGPPTSAYRDDGAICIGLLKAEAWKPSTKIDQVLRALVQLLEEPNPDDALVASIAEVFTNDRAKFDQNAQDWVQKYAK
ncbi:hypothetical protein OIO90_005695 [Microbotryomycetes sp. JL221]|nr:hypothetical protein OIO90_005695 [Microbotryomycetes sp. JL221]